MICTTLFCITSAGSQVSWRIWLGCMQFTSYKNLIHHFVMLLQLQAGQLIKGVVAREELFTINWKSWKKEKKHPTSLDFFASVATFKWFTIDWKSWREEKNLISLKMFASVATSKWFMINWKCQRKKRKHWLHLLNNSIHSRVGMISNCHGIMTMMMMMMMILGSIAATKVWIREQQRSCKSWIIQRNASSVDQPKDKDGDGDKEKQKLL